MAKTRAILLLLLGAGGCASHGEPNDSEVAAKSTEADPCRARTIEELCAAATCPATPDAVPWECGSAFPTKHYRTTCAGTRVMRSTGFTNFTWVFDENDRLIGAESWSDVSEACTDGSYASTIIYGETCEAMGEGSDLCDRLP